MPTVTDANVVLGRLLPEAFLGGDMSLDKTASEKAVQTTADALGIGLIEAAKGIIDVVNDHMVRALRVMSVQRGEDPKDYALVSFGGAGGLHVCALAEALEMKHALVPVHAGVLSALGMLAAEQSRERSRTVKTLIQDCENKELDEAFLELVTQAKEDIHESVMLQKVSVIASEARRSPNDKVQSPELDIKRSVDVRYKGQSHTLSLQWSGLESIEQAFHLKHKDSYGHEMEIDVELVNIRVRVVEQKQAFKLPAWEPTESKKETMDSIPVINRISLAVGQKIVGPALITEVSSTTWLAQGWVAIVDEMGNLLLSS